MLLYGENVKWAMSEWHLQQYQQWWFLVLRRCHQRWMNINNAKLLRVSFPDYPPPLWNVNTDVVQVGRERVGEI